MSKFSDALENNHGRSDDGRKPGGLICPICGHGRFKVDRVKNNATGQIRRVKVCLSCGRKIKTLEVIIDEDKPK